MVDAQEAGALFKGFRPKAAHLQQLLAVLETAVFVTPANYVLRHHARQTGDARQRHRSGIQIDAHGVHTIFYHRIEFSPALADIVLILANANRFRVNFDQLCQRILQTGDDTAPRRIEIGGLPEAE